MAVPSAASAAQHSTSESMPPIRDCVNGRLGWMLGLLGRDIVIASRERAQHGPYDAVKCSI